MNKSIAWMRKNAIFFDDNLEVLNMVRYNGIRTINATLANERLTA
jgi:hypothetical protein